MLPMKFKPEDGSVNDLDIHIRDIRIDDYDALIALWKATGLPFKPKGRDSREDIERQIGLSCTIYRVAVLDRRIVGAILGSHDGRKGWINRLAVLPEYTRQGVAKALVADVEAILGRLSTRLHPYAVPREIRLVPHFPLNQNGKVDRKALFRMLECESA